MEVFIKNMVCARCLKVVKQVFEALSLPVTHIKLGEVHTSKTIDEQTLSVLKDKLRDEGFEIIQDKSSRLVSQIKTKIIELIHQQPDQLSNKKLSTLLTDTIPHDYSYLSHLFCSVSGVTLERYFILQKIERAKELIVYDEMNLSEIADHLGYSSVQHLSNQFKQITGLTPSYYRKVSAERKGLDNV